MAHKVPRNLEGKTAIITGGASGIGAALARALGRRGAEVVVADRQKSLADAVAGSLRTSGGRATAVEVDVRDLSAMKSLVVATIARSGGVDFFFNNAGIGVGGEIDTYEREDWDDVIDVNLRGVAYGIQAVYPHMIERGSGHIVNTASMAGLVGAVGEGSYAAAKHAVVGLSKTLRIEAKRHGVRVSVLCPGAVRTPILTGGEFGRMNYDGLSRANIEKLWALVRPMDVDVFAERALESILANEAIIVQPAWWKALWYVERISPALSERLWAALLDRLRHDIQAMGGRPRPSPSRRGPE